MIRQIKRNTHRTNASQQPIGPLGRARRAAARLVLPEGPFSATGLRADGRPLGPRWRFVGNQGAAPFGMNHSYAAPTETVFFFLFFFALYSCRERGLFSVDATFAAT